VIACTGARERQQPNDNSRTTTAERQQPNGNSTITDLRGSRGLTRIDSSRVGEMRVAGEGVLF